MCTNCSSTHLIHLNLLLAISKHSPAQLFSGQKLWTGVTNEGTKIVSVLNVVASGGKYSFVPVYIIFKYLHIL